MQLLHRGPGASAAPGRLGIVSCAALVAFSVIACGPGTSVRPTSGAEAVEQSVERYQFTRSARVLVRIDTATGQTWFVSTTGDGGWEPAGSTPDALGKPSLPGRYRVYTLEGSRRPAGNPTHRLLRVDGETGRAWTMELLEDPDWIGIEEPEGRAIGEDAPAGSPAPAAVAPPQSGEPPAAQQQPMTGADLDVVSRKMIADDEAGAAEFAKNLVQALEKDGMPPDVQAWSARQLGQFPKEVAVPPLLNALESEHPVVVVAAIHALRETGDPTTIPQILQLQSHPDPSVRAAAQEVVREVR